MLQPYRQALLDLEQEVEAANQLQDNLFNMAEGTFNNYLCVLVPWRSTSDNISRKLQAGPGSFHILFEGPLIITRIFELKAVLLFVKFQLLFPSVLGMVETIKSQKVRNVRITCAMEMFFSACTCLGQQLSDDTGQNNITSL